MRAVVVTAGMLALLLASCAGDPGSNRKGTPPSPQRPAASPADAPPSPVPAAAAQAPGDPAVLPARVTRVIDGDTLEVRLTAGGTERVRLIGIDTPEDTREHEYFGPEATAATARRAGGMDVWLERDVEERDRYGRLLAYVWLEIPRQSDEPEARGKMLNAILVAEGFAQLMTVPPNVKYADLFVKLQREARDGNTGMWPGILAGSPERAAPAAPAPPAASPGTGDCDPSYPDVCIPPPPPDLDCSDVPYRRFRVLPPDPHRFDQDRDGVGCER